MAILNRIRRLLTGGPEPFPDLPDVTIKPIGVVRNREKKPKPNHWADVVSRIIIRPDLEDALLGIGSYSHLLVLFWPHEIPPDVLGSKHQLHPRDDPQNPLMGVLATRSQIRFNPILATAVELLGVKGNVLRVRGLDAINRTPVLDIKPYLPHFDSKPDAKVPGWLTEMREHASGR